MRSRYWGVRICLGGMHDCRMIEAQRLRTLLVVGAPTLQGGGQE
jgi:hypothetical protein